MGLRPSSTVAVFGTTLHETELVSGARARSLPDPPDFLCLMIGRPQRRTKSLKLHLWVMYVYTLSHFSCVQLCNPMGYSLPSSSVHGILQARILEWVAMPFSRGSSRPRDQTHIFYVSCIVRRVLYHWDYLESPCDTGFYYPYPLVVRL